LPVISWLDDTTTREVWVSACAQSGKSTLGTGWIGYTVDVEPIPFAVVMPREGDAAERCEANIIPMFEENPRLLSHARNSARNINIGKMTMFDNMAFYLLHTNVAMELAGKSLGRIHFDEGGKYPSRVKNDADPISLGRRRLRTFKNRCKLYSSSTPVATDDLFDVGWSAGDCCEWWVPCAHCGRYHKMTFFDNVILDKTPDRKLLEAEDYRQGGHASYVCNHCGVEWTESERWEAVVAGQFVPGKYEINENGLWVDEDGNECLDRGESTVYRSARIHAVMLHPAIQTIGDLAGDWAAATLAKKRGKYT